jgi:hypothetical protein
LIPVLIGAFIVLLVYGDDANSGFAAEVFGVVDMEGDIGTSVSVKNNII